MTNMAIIYYSATGNVYELARAAEQGAREQGADTRLRKVRELAPQEAIAANAAWQHHSERTQDVAEAELADLEWADGVVFGTPTRFGNASAQLKQFIDQCGPLWQAGALQDKAVAALTSSSTLHGGQESTLLSLYTVFMHWGMVLVPPGYTHPNQFVTGNPYGASHVSGGGEYPISDETRASARYLGERVSRFADAILPVGA